MKRSLETDILKGVSRSFYLSLRFLPEEMRGAASVGYLLARTTDTVADSVGVDVEERVRALDAFSAAVVVGEKFSGWSEELLEGVGDARERVLLEAADEVLSALESLGDFEASLVRELLEVIAKGQKLDLERFDGGGVVALASDAELEDYTWRVAGCVGVFWTRLGYGTMGERFSKEAQEIMEEWGCQYGKGLQLVNILRDLPEDLAMGRCYLPVEDPTDGEALERGFSKWKGVASEWVSQGVRYSAKLESKRLRIASGLPASIAEETLKLVRFTGSDFSAEKAKVPRWQVYRLLFMAFVSG
ncbi:MAG: phytoene/squalene synthase family protein [Luteolibacter sp.]